MQNPGNNSIPRFFLDPIQNHESVKSKLIEAVYLELVSKELNHLLAILHVSAEGLIFMK